MGTHSVRGGEVYFWEGSSNYLGNRYNYTILKQQGDFFKAELTKQLELIMTLMQGGKQRQFTALSYQGLALHQGASVVMSLQCDISSARKYF
jgi:hypothetical protein